jgi:ketosteroid isomerase-like protein
MSRENVEIVRFAYEQVYAQRSTDIPGVRERIADDFRFHLRRGFPGRTVYHRDEMTEVWADLEATFTDYSLTPESYEALGDYVVVTLHQSARLRGSSQRIDETICHLWHVVAGKAREGWTFGRKGEALEAAGLRSRATPPPRKAQRGGSAGG